MLDAKNKEKANQEALSKQKNESDRNIMLQSMTKDFGSVFEPYLKKLEQKSSVNFQELSKIIAESLKVDVPALDTTRMEQVLEAGFAGIKLPAPKVNVTVPPIRVPDLQMPDQMDIKGWINLMGYDKGLLQNPLPVQIRDKDGKPVTFGGGSSSFGGGAGGNVVIQNDANHPVPVTGTLSVSGTSTTASVPTNRDGVVYNSDNPMPVTITSGATATSASNIVDSSGVAYSGSNPLPITGSISTSPGSTFFASDAVLSVNVIQSLGNATSVGTGYQDNALRVVQATDSVSSVNVIGTVPISSGSSLLVDQLSGSNWSVNVLTMPAVVVTSITNTTASNIVDSSGVAYSGSNPVPITGTVVVSSVTASTQSALIDSTGVQYSGSNPVPVTLITETITLSDTTDSINTLQVSGAVDSVNVLQIAGTAVDTNTGASSAGSQRVVLASNSNLSTQTLTDAMANADTTADTAFLAGFNGTSWDRLHTGGFDSLGALRVTNATDAVTSVNVTSSVALTVTSITNSTAASLVDSSGVQYSGSNPLSVTVVSGASTSTLAVGDSAARTADNGGNPVKMGGIAIQANPTAYTAGDRSNFMTDDLGRQLTRPVQVRDLIATAYATFATGTEATLLAGVAANYFDLIYILASNNSTAAVGIDIRPSTAGSIVMHLEIPPNGTVGVSTPVPIPQQATGDGTGGTWTVDLPDITGTTVSVSGLFTKEI